MKNVEKVRLKSNHLKKNYLNLFFFFFMITPLTLYSQGENRIFYDDFVECYFDNSSSDSLSIYDSINGNVLISLKINEKNKKRSWFKIAIKETKNGWANIENIMLVPGLSKPYIDLQHYKNHWIKIKNLRINTVSMSLPDSLGVSFYEKPNINSKTIVESGEFLKLTLIETKGLWAKVSFTKNGIKYVAWIERKNQCAYPWTSCF